MHLTSRLCSLADRGLFQCTAPKQGEHQTLTVSMDVHLLSLELRGNALTWSQEPALCSYSSMTERLDFALSRSMVCLLSMTSKHVAHAGNPNAQNWWHFYGKRGGAVSRTSCLWKQHTRNTSRGRPFGKYYFSLVYQLSFFFLWIRGQVLWDQSLFIRIHSSCH